MYHYDIIYILLMGLIAGWSAGKIMKGKGFGLVGDLVIGLLGALLGSWIFWQLDIERYGFLGSVLAALTGALLLLYALRLAQKKRK